MLLGCRTAGSGHSNTHFHLQGILDPPTPLGHSHHPSEVGAEIPCPTQSSVRSSHPIAEPLN